MINFFSKRTRIVFLIFAAIIVALGLYLFVARAPVPKVISTIPADGSTEVLESSQISINFNEDITESTKNNIFVSFEPNVNFDSTWLTNTLKIIPKTNLENNTKYNIIVQFSKKEIYRFSFETATFSQEQIKKFGALQSQNDYVFGQATKKVVEQYPWYTSLPIKTKNFVIYYDFDQQKFAITFLVTIQSADQQNSLIQEALNDIRAIGVKDPIQYYTQP